MQQTVRRVEEDGDDNLRARLIWGAKDNVVNTVDYAVDIRVAFEAEGDHRSVCKPSPAYSRPLKWVLDVI